MPARRAVSGRSQEPRRRFTEELRELRHARGLSLREVAQEINWDHSYLGRMETGETLGSPEIVQALDAFYGTRQMLILWELAQRDPSQFRARYQRYMSMEGEATAIQEYMPGSVPGLLQTEPYARWLLRAGGIAGEDLERQVKARIGRAETLTGPQAPHFRALLSEAVLHTALPDPADWRRQLAHLAEMVERPNVAVQVVPLVSVPHPLANTNVAFVRLPEGHTVAWVETAYSGELVEETAAVERLQLSYDQLRDQALTTAASRTLILKFLEEVPCEPESS